jgi:hypothetical protein
MIRRVLIVLLFTLVLATNGWTQVRELKRYTTYQTSLTKEDIVRSFVNEVRAYLQRYDRYGCYYHVGFEVYQEKDKQNYTWTTKTTENVYQWGTIYSIYLYISNATLWVEFSNISFKTRDQSAQEIITTRSNTVGGNMIRKHIVDTATSMFDESTMVLTMNNISYTNESIEAFSKIFLLLN